MTRQSGCVSFKLFGLLLFFLLAMWSCSDGGVSETETPCETDAECDLGFRCQSNICVAADACTEDEDCPEGMRCLDGYCMNDPSSDGDQIVDGDPDLSGDTDLDSPADEDVEPDIVIDGDLEQEPDVILEAAMQVPESVDFPPLLRDESLSKDLLIESTGEGDLVISSISLAYEGGDFTIVNPPTSFPFTLPSGDSYALSIRYLQSNNGADSNEVVIESNAVDQAEARVRVQSVQSGQPQLRCDAESLDFGTVDVLDNPASLVLTCYNDEQIEGDMNVLEISDLTITPEEGVFALGVDVPNKLYIRTGESAEIEVEFDPFSEGEFSGELKLSHNAASIMSPLAIDLSGIGGSKHLTITPDVLHFGTVKLNHDSTKEISLSATGLFPVTIRRIEMDSSTSSDFTVQLGTLFDDGDLVLEPETEPVVITVTFAPTSLNSQDGNLVIYSNAAEGSQISIPLDGTGTNFELYTLPDVLDFGAVAVNDSDTLQFSLINGGNQPVLIQSVRYDGETEFSASGIVTPFTIQTGETIPFQIGFAPTEERAYEAQLVFTTDDPIFPEYGVQVLGIGSLPHLQLSPAETDYDFGDVTLGEMASVDYVVSNLGLIPLVLSNLHWISTALDPNAVISMQYTGSMELGPEDTGILSFYFTSPTGAVPGGFPSSATREFGFSTNDQFMSSMELTLTGRMVDPYVEIIPAGPVYDFGNQRPGYESLKEISITNGGSGTLAINGISFTSGSSANFSFIDLPTAFPVLVGDESGAQSELTFTIRFYSDVMGQSQGILRILNDGYIDQDMQISLLGQVSNCDVGTHNCDGTCVSDSDVNHCGSLCEPCYEPEHSVAYCEPFSQVYRCNFECQGHYTEGNGYCVPVNEPDCCGDACDNCTVSLPEHAVGLCDNGVCDYGCEAGYHRSGADCVVNDTADCCGDLCLDCPAKPNADPACVQGVCSYVCQSPYDDCNGQAYDGCEINLDENIMHCGECRNICEVAYGWPMCDEGECAVESCNFGRGDCNDSYSDGCETNTFTSALHCGECRNSCAVDNGTSICNNGVCKITSCEYPWGNCDDDFTTGCGDYVADDPENCGICNYACEYTHAQGVCTDGSCSMGLCDEGYKDCQSTNGCETDIYNDINNCGDCNSVCSILYGVGQCVQGDCQVLSCDQGRGHCDDNIANGCETLTNTDPQHCGSCEVSCDYDNATGHCTAGHCWMGACDGTYQDCNLDDSDGCEADLQTDMDHCGLCNDPCENFEHRSGAVCSSGDCTQGPCDEGWDNCDGIADSSCETDIYNNVTHCGGCLQECELDFVVDHVCVDGECDVAEDGCLTGYDNCNGVAEDGCEVNLMGDPHHCGGCDISCWDLNPGEHVDQYLCVGGECLVGTCENGWGNCDEQEYNGCEHDVSSDVDNCGSCGHSCNLPGGTAECNGGVCDSNCVDGHADCDLQSGNGCEVDLTVPGFDCAHAVQLQNIEGGSEIRGDAGSDVSEIVTGVGEMWYKVRIREGSGWCTYLSAWAILSVPPGMNYTLEARKGSCAATPITAAQGTGLNEVVKFCEDDDYFSDDDFDVYLHIDFTSGNQCSEWSLQVAGNQSVSGCDCNIFK